uniref:Papain-like cysteine peptidase n=1 Tax=viral metagenome TaxID=1070528 RepID=A0A6C0AQA6_9ZZZZ
MVINYLTLGYDCSPAAVLRNLNIRKFALPFDWVVSDVNILEKCFEDNFSKFHKNLKFNYNKTRLIDEYGFQFPHDYPLNNMTNINNNNVGEGIFGEEKNNFITDNWINYYDVVLEKYNRRIERFKIIVNDINPIIVLCRYNTKQVFKLQEIFLKYFNKQNVYFLNSSNQVFENSKIKNIYTEKNGEWNNTNIWKQGLLSIISKIKQS